jgi:hypothetical protein
MTKEQGILSSAQHTEYILGYGSLLSADSRQRYSQMHVEAIPALLKGWKRSWITRSEHEQQTYVGAVPEFDSYINGALLSVTGLSPSLRTREQDYHFVAVPIKQITLYDAGSQACALEQQLEKKTVWLCESKNKQSATADFPIYQSYVDTCMVGCLEFGIEHFAKEFALHTSMLDSHWINDRVAPQYPRSAIVSVETQNTIDAILTEIDVIKYRGDF